MDRRGFLQRLVAGVAALAIDPEKLLWRPEAKTIFIPPAPVIVAPDFEYSMSIQITSAVRQLIIPGVIVRRAPSLALRAGIGTELKVGGQRLAAEYLSLESEQQWIEVTQLEEPEPGHLFHELALGLQEQTVQCDFKAQEPEVMQIAKQMIAEQTFQLALPDGRTFEFEGVVKNVSDRNYLPALAI